MKLLSVKCFACNSGAGRPGAGRPAMAAPILWAPGIFAFFLQENLHAHKIPRFREGGAFGVLGGEVPILFLWALGFF